MIKNQNFKKIISLIVLATGFITAYLVIANGNLKKPGSVVSALTGDKNSNQALNFELQRTAPLNSKTGENSSASETENLTDSLIRTYALEIFKRNPEGPQLINNQQSVKMPKEALFEDALKEKLNQDLGVTPYETKDIKINADNSSASVKKYLESLQIATQKNFKNFKKNPYELFGELLDNGNPDPIYGYLARTSTYLNELLDIATPSSWQIFHLQLVNFQRKKIIVYESLLSLEEDPLKALIAVNQIEKIAEESENLATVLNEQLKQLSI